MELETKLHFINDLQLKNISRELNYDVIIEKTEEGILCRDNQQSHELNETEYMITHVGTQIIETEHLLLRRFEYSDIDSMLRNWIADEKTQWDYGEPCYSTPEAVLELFNTKYISSYSKEDYYRWAVIEKETLECIGQIAFFVMDTANRHGEIEYVIGPAFQGKGYATEMTKAVIAYGFNKINLHRIEIDCRTENTASQRVIEKCGLTYEGVFRDFFWRKDHYEGRKVFSILKQDWIG